MKLIVGLGNPGKEYQDTRHNIGFMVVDKYANEKNITFSKEKFGGVYTECIINNEKVIIVVDITVLKILNNVLEQKIINDLKLVFLIIRI